MAVSLRSTRPVAKVALPNRVGRRLSALRRILTLRARAGMPFRRGHPSRSCQDSTVMITRPGHYGQVSQDRSATVAHLTDCLVTSSAAVLDDLFSKCELPHTPPTDH